MDNSASQIQCACFSEIKVGTLINQHLKPWQASLRETRTALSDCVAWIAGWFRLASVEDLSRNMHSRAAPTIAGNPTVKPRSWATQERRDMNSSSFDGFSSQDSINDLIRWHSIHEVVLSQDAFRFVANLFKHSYGGHIILMHIRD